jgi:acyl carrier protein
VLEKLKAILVELGIPEKRLQEDTLLYGHLGLDSVETVRLALELKRRLGIEVKLGSRQDLTLGEISRMAEIASPSRSQFGKLGPHPPTPSSISGEGELDQSSSPRGRGI